MPPKSATQHLKDIKALVEAKDEQTLKQKYRTTISHCKSIDNDVDRANKTFHKTHVKSGEEKANNCQICNPNWRERATRKKPKTSCVGKDSDNPTDVGQETEEKETEIEREAKAKGMKIKVLEEF